MSQNMILESELTCPECGHKKIETMNRPGFRGGFNS